MTDTQLLDALIALKTETVIVLDPSGHARVNVGNAGPVIEPDLRTALAKAIQQYASR